MVGKARKTQVLAAMTTWPNRDYPNNSSSIYRKRVVSSIAFSVVLLTIFITWDSLLLILSRPNSSVISNSFDGVEDHIIRDSSLYVHNNEGVQVAKVDLNQDSDVKLEVRVRVGVEVVEVESSSEDAKEVEDQNSSSTSEGDDSECDLYHGEWYYDPKGPLYTNNTCPILTQNQNCQGNGRPDKEYENWRWKPYNCELPRFDPTKFLELMSGKTITFVGDSVARNQMESLMCMLWQVETPINRGNKRMQRWQFKSKNVTILRFWSAWLVNTTTEPFNNIKDDILKMFLDVPDNSFMDHAPKSDVVIFSNGHWFPKKAIYFVNNKVAGGQLWTPPNKKKQNVTTTEAFEISTETTLTALATHPSYSGLTIVTTYSPDHYENGAWNTGGSCTGKVRPLLPGKVVEYEYTNSMHDKQASGFYKATKKKTNKSKLKLMDITEAFKYRHDGHPGPYRNPDPKKITQRGLNGRPPPQDCLHWCMPGPVDIWNEMMLEIIKREFEHKK